MKHQPNFENTTLETGTPEQRRLKILISDLGRKVRILDNDVAFEEQRSGIADRSDAQYSMLARTAAARSENLKMTIVTLEVRLVLANSVAPVAATTRPAPKIRRLRRGASPRRLAAWLRLRSFADAQPDAAGAV
jgi:hypothetical protein